MNRGHEVELGEIEAVLREHPGIAAAAVVATGNGTERRLLGFAVPATGPDEELGGERERRFVDRLGRVTDPDQALVAAVHRVAAGYSGRDRLRVLQVGTDVDDAGATAAVLAGFTVDYLRTAPAAAPEAQGEHKWVRNGRFDPARTAVEQGLRPNTVDLVVTGRAVTRADHPRAVLARLVGLVAPGGWLVLRDEDGDTTGTLIDQVGGRRLVTTGGDGPQVTVARIKADRAAPNPDEIVTFLAQRLPRHLVPAVVQVVDSVPFAADGEVDRRTLASWEPTDGAGPGSYEAPVDALEAAVAAIAGQVLELSGVGRTESFAALGADSLVLAQMAGRMHDEIPEAGLLTFDAVLRELLNEPTVATLSAAMRAAATAPVPSQAVAREPGATGNARLVSMGGAGDPLRVLIHAGPGTVDCYVPLAARLAAQELGSVLGIAIADLDTYCTIPATEVMTRLADDYARRLLGTGHRKFQLVGYCVGGIITTEVGLRLLEAGAQIADFTLIDSLPGLTPIDEELVIEATFLPDLGLHPLAPFADLDERDLMRAFDQVLQNNGGTFPAGGFATLGGDPGLDAVRVAADRMGARAQGDRLADYGRLMAEQAAVPPFDPEMIPNLYRMYRQSFLASQHEPPPYPGDITFLRAELASYVPPNVAAGTLAYWRRVCQGELDVIDIGGGHLTCIEEPHAADVARHLAAGLT